MIEEEMEMVFSENSLPKEKGLYHAHPTKK